jgi:hypothetical protein
MFRKLGGTKIKGKVFTEEAALRAAHDVVLNHVGESQKRKQNEENARARHNARRPVGIGGESQPSSFDLDENDPDVMDGTKPPRRVTG